MRDPAELMVKCHPIDYPFDSVSSDKLVSLASLLPGWGVSLLARHHEYGSCIAKFSCAVASSADVPIQ